MTGLNYVRNIRVALTQFLPWAINEWMQPFCRWTWTNVKGESNLGFFLIKTNKTMFFAQKNDLRFGWEGNRLVGATVLLLCIC